MESLEKALAELREAILNQSTFVRAVFSGRRRNMETQFERMDLRPVLIKGELQIQLSYSDGR